MADYFVYENWVHEYAKIHRGGCPYCNQGHGVHPDAGDDNGRWHGPFGTLGEAHCAAEATGEEVSACGHCRP